MLRENMEKKMNREELAKVEFYCGSAVHTVLQRYEFTQEERQVIQRAILTAKKSKPNIALIDEADALLKECAAMRVPKIKEVDSSQTAKSIAKIKMGQYSQKKGSIWRDPMDGTTQMFATVLAVGTMMITINYFLGDDVSSVISSGSIPKQTQTYTFEEAKLGCAKEGKVLPLTAYDLISGEQRLISYAEYWLDSRQVASIEEAMATGTSHTAKNEQKYLFTCVSKNGNKNIF